VPSKSKKQERTMSAIAHGWKPPKDSSVAQIPKSVAKDFHAADKTKAKSGHKAIHNLGGYAHPPKKGKKK
jgi:hypothetical protein